MSIESWVDCLIELIKETIELVHSDIQVSWRCDDSRIVLGYGHIFEVVSGIKDGLVDGVCQASLLVEDELAVAEGDGEDTFIIGNCEVYCPRLGVIIFQDLLVGCIFLKDQEPTLAYQIDLLPIRSDFEFNGAEQDGDLLLSCVTIACVLKNADDVPAEFIADEHLPVGSCGDIFAHRRKGDSELTFNLAGEILGMGRRQQD